MDNIRLNNEIISQELSRVSVVGVNTADLGCREKNVFRLLIPKECPDLVLLNQVQLFLPGEIQRFRNLDDSDLVTVVIDNPDLSRFRPFDDSVLALLLGYTDSSFTYTLPAIPTRESRRPDHQAEGSGHESPWKGCLYLFCEKST